MQQKKKPAPTAPKRTIPLRRRDKNPSTPEEIRAHLERNWKTWASTTHTWIELVGGSGPSTDDYDVYFNMSVILKATRDWALHHLASELLEEKRDPGSSDYHERTDNVLIPALQEVVRAAEATLVLIMVPAKDAQGVDAIFPVSAEAKCEFVQFVAAHGSALGLMRKELTSAIGHSEVMMEVLEIDETIAEGDAHEQLAEEHSANVGIAAGWRSKIRRAWPAPVAASAGVAFAYIFGGWRTLAAFLALSIFSAAVWKLAKRHTPELKTARTETRNLG